MRPIFFHIPGLGLPIFGYGTMLFLAFLGSMHLAAWCARRAKLDPEIMYDLAIWIFTGGLIGARAFYVWQYWGTRVTSLWEFFAVWRGGIVLYGSILGGTATFFFYRAIRPFPLRPALDAIAPALALGIALGRIGCFLNGCCYGDICDPKQIPWAVRFPRESPPWNDQYHRGLIASSAPKSLPVHPTQLYSSLDGFILLGLLLTYYPLRRRDGEVMALLMVTYPITRFLIEHLRNDEGVFFAGLTISQNLSILLLIFGLIFWARLVSWPEERHADAVREPAA
jgi:phosphatidylglycerol:prolipoprotein diacylglycerol transferase